MKLRNINPRGPTGGLVPRWLFSLANSGTRDPGYSDTKTESAGFGTLTGSLRGFDPKFRNPAKPTGGHCMNSGDQMQCSQLDTSRTYLRISCEPLQNLAKNCNPRSIPLQSQLIIN
jgi:hypothetical protein